MDFVVKISPTESTGVAFEKLLSSSFNEIELNVAIDGLSSVGTGDTEEGSPFLIRAEHVSDNLVVLEVACPVENLDLFALIGNVDMIDGVGGDNTEDVGVDPSPEDDVLIELDVLKLGLGVQVEDLEDVAGWLVGGFEGDDVVADVHDGTINLAAGTPNTVHLVSQFDDADLGGSLSILVSDTHVLF